MQVDRERAIEDLRSVALQRSVVEIEVAMRANQRVQAPERGDDLIEVLLYGILAGEVDRPLTSDAIAELSGGLRQSLGVQVGEQDPSALGGEDFGSPPPDPGGGAGDPAARLRGKVCLITGAASGIGRTFPRRRAAGSIISVIVGPLFRVGWERVYSDVRFLVAVSAVRCG